MTMAVLHIARNDAIERASVLPKEAVQHLDDSRPDSILGHILRQHLSGTDACCLEFKSTIWVTLIAG